MSKLWTGSALYRSTQSEIEFIEFHFESLKAESNDVHHHSTLWKAVRQTVCNIRMAANTVE